MRLKRVNRLPEITSEAWYQQACTAVHTCSQTSELTLQHQVVQLYSSQTNFYLSKIRNL